MHRLGYRYSRWCMSILHYPPHHNCTINWNILPYRICRMCTGNETVLDPPPPTVAVVGCGPAGMFFLHAIETKRRELKEKGDVVGLARLPIATCFDKAPAPGGVWRAEREFRDADENEAPRQEAVDEKKDMEKTVKTCEANMYEALWTNGAKENTEFFDYTYDDHFGCRLPVHLPRRAVLDYMMARVTRNAPNLFQDHARFNTSVVNVSYNEDTSKFEVLTRHVHTGKESKGLFDKCIWAAGDNGKPFVPRTILSVFEDGNFQGKLVHSSDSSDLKQNVSGKKVLMVGGSYSAEDLALMAIKLGADKIYVSHRDKYAPVTWTSKWPQNKVELLSELVPVRVTEGGRCIQFSEAWYNYEEQEFCLYDKVEKEIRDISTVIFCTGYDRNLSMLDKSLRPPSLPVEGDDFTIPSDWEMTPNEFTPELGDVPVGDVTHVTSSYVKPGLYRGVLISNPSMMFSYGGLGEEPLFETDAYAYKFLAYITGTTELPTKEEMRRRNNKQFQREMQIPWKRYYFDVNYRRAMDAALKKVDGVHWCYDTEDERYKSVMYKQYTYPWKVSAIHTKDGQYPVDIGSHDADVLTNIGKAYYDLSCESGKLRKLPDATDDEYAWRTFRDYGLDHAERFASVFTGTKAVPLKKQWMEVDEEEDVLW